MNIHTVIPLATLPVLIALLAIVLRSKQIPSRPFLLVYVLAACAWSLGAIALHSGYFAEYSASIGWFLPLAGVWTVVAYSQFACAFAGKRTVIWTVVGYALVAALTALAVREYVPQATTGAGAVAIDALQGPARYVLIAGVSWFAALPVLYLVLTHRSTADARIRNEAVYLAAGALIAGALSFRMVAPSLLEYPIEHIGHAGNAVLITCVLVRSELPDFRSVARKGLVYMSASLLVAPLYLLGLWGLYSFSGSWSAPVGVATAVGMIFVLPWLLIALRKPVRRTIDRALYGDSLSHREMVRAFPRRMGNVLSIQQLGEGLLQGIPRAVAAPYASLLLAANGDFTTQYSNHLRGNEMVTQIKLGSGSPIVSWLEENGKSLSCDWIEAGPEFKDLHGDERDALRAMNVGLLVPMNSQGKLVGILAVGRKRSGRSYSSDDIDLLARVCSESAAAMGNAQLYAQTKERVHTDELTGLLNHGYFHQRMDEEISRCSRFGSVFSVIFLDVDMFKSYNDAFGHLAGDEMLRQIAEYIRDSIRGIDIGFRYGGDEFAVVLPASSLDDARHVAERVRRRVESEMESRGIALTCSMGIAAWPSDGVTREKLLRAADSALYLSKEKGRNQISFASEVVDARQGHGNDVSRESEVLSTVHALAATVDAKDANTYGHSKKTSEYAVYIAQALGYPAEDLTVVKASALLHDIGKIRVPDTILVKPGPLSDAEWLAMREHPRFGVSILKHIKGLSGCLPTIQHHHERFDGTGYPAGLGSDEIPFDARILAVADAYDAMTSSRPYRGVRLSHQEAIDELARCAGRHFDPKIVRVFDKLWEPLDSHITASGVTRLAKRTTESGQRVLELLSYVAQTR